MDFTSAHTLQLLFDTRDGLKGSRLGHGNDDPTIDRTSKYSAVDDLMDDAEMYTYEELMRRRALGSSSSLCLFLGDGCLSVLSPRQSQRYYDETDMLVNRMGEFSPQASVGHGKELDSPGLPRTRTMATLGMQRRNRGYIGPQMELMQAESKTEQPQVVPFKANVAPGETGALFPKKPLFRRRVPEPVESSDDEVYDFDGVDHYAARRARHMREIERLGGDSGLFGLGGEVSPTASTLMGGGKDIDIDIYVPPFDAKRVCKMRVPADTKVGELETLILNQHTEEFGLKPLEHSYHLRWLDDDEVASGGSDAGGRTVIEPDMDLPALDSHRAVGALNARELCLCYSDWEDDSESDDTDVESIGNPGAGEIESTHSSMVERSITRSSAARASTSGISSQATAPRPHATQQRTLTIRVLDDPSAELVPPELMDRDECYDNSGQLTKTSLLVDEEMPLTDVIGLLARKQQVDPDELERYYTLLVCKADPSQGYYEPVTDTLVSRLQSDNLVLKRKVG
ncbi:hypothetical protein FOL47_005347 [Perkinsus chesapeaki]|uniref:Uncharacterized protein n=1 Tax=Perkinsus chesapeaki TaxID=330153 RepID=A0A7J6N2E0_PERCH|nr:hypothetical protein FOL47_005347 [Perkinsus chesapeaki]